MPRLVAGVDSSTQSCKVVIVDADTGEVVRQGRAAHPDGTEVNPEHWWTALQDALAQAGGLDGVAAISIGGQQHGMVVLDAEGCVIRDALLWNDTRSADQAEELIAHFGAAWLLENTGSVPVASFTSTKLRWLAQHEPENADRVAAVMLPHDWLSWRLSGFGERGKSPLGADFSRSFTDRSDASGTGYFNSRTDAYVDAVLEFCLGAHTAESIYLPRVLVGDEVGALVHGTTVAIAPGAGDNAGAARGLGLVAGDAVISIGTSGTVFSISEDAGGDRAEIAGFADTTGRFLPLACTLNAAQVLDRTAKVLGVDFNEFERLALAAPAGSEGLMLLPFFQGERTPNLPRATASWHGATLENFTRENIARASIEGILLTLANALDLFRNTGRPVHSVKLIGGAASNRAVQVVAAGLFGGQIEVPNIAEYVALGAARQAAATIGCDSANWPVVSDLVAEPAYDPAILARFQELVSKLESV